MYRMDKLTTGIAYGTSAGNAGFWMLQLLDKVSPSQWAAIGVLGSLVFGLLTYRKRPARTVLTGMCYSAGSVMRQGSSSLTRLTGQSAMTSRTWRR
ncbi:class II holin family protein [Klebsiella variicola]|uniref:class II holin family protein n=1 Tax=Klebsiella variicola TaxID=244366 RepID=UPI0035AB6FD6